MSCVVALLLVHVINLGSYHNITIIIIIDSAVTIIYNNIYNCVVMIHDMLHITVCDSVGHHT